MAKNGQYYVTEQEIAKLLGTSGLPMAFTSQFTRDYAAVKSDIGSNSTSLDKIISDVDALDVRVLTTESNIATINSDIDSLNTSVLTLTLQAADFEIRISDTEIGLSTLDSGFNLHITDDSAHGATGNIVGTDDFCTTSVGGTVLLATALAQSTASTLSITTTPNAAGVGYVQADAASWVTTINELKTDFNALIAEFNLLVAKVNDILITQEVAKQRDT